MSKPKTYKPPRITRALEEWAHAIGVTIHTVSYHQCRNEQGIHLLTPDKHALVRALEDAEAKLFPAIYIHGPKPEATVISLSEFRERKIS
jgi:hypothetical protein